MAVGRFNKINFGSGLAVTDEGGGEITVSATGGGGSSSDPPWAYAQYSNLAYTYTQPANQWKEPKDYGAGGAQIALTVSDNGGATYFGLSSRNRLKLTMGYAYDISVKAVGNWEKTRQVALRAYLYSGSTLYAQPDSVGIAGAYPDRQNEVEDDSGGWNYNNTAGYNYNVKKDGLLLRYPPTHVSYNAVEIAPIVIIGGAGYYVNEWYLWAKVLGKYAATQTVATY